MRPSAEITGLPFDEAIKFFQQKINLPTETWKDIWKGMHARAFVIAGATKAELLTDLRGAVDKAISQGTSLKTFRDDFDKIVQKHGWKYKGGKGWRTSVIYNTNIATAYAAGHHAQMTDPAVLKVRPYLRYVPSSSREPRPEHMQWYNIILPADDPFWSTHKPPNGWGCKCGVVNHSAREVERIKKEEADGPHPVKTKAPEIEHYQWTDKATGKVHRIPKGIDPGWDYDVGEAAWGKNQALRLMEDKGPWIDIDPWGPEKYGRPEKIDVIDTPVAKPSQPAKKTELALYEALWRVVGKKGRGFTDPVGGNIMVTDAIADHILKDPAKRWDGREAYFPLIPELIENPYEIWASFARSEVSGRIGIRRKYVKAIRLKDKKIIGLWAETMDGHWVSGDFFRGGLTGAGNLRKGRMVYGRK